MYQEALTLAYSGQVREARKKVQHAMTIAQQASLPERAAQFGVGAALWEGLFGNKAEARAGATAALNRSRGRDVQYGAAAAFGLAGDSAESQTLSTNPVRFPRTLPVRVNYLPQLRALLALAEGQPARAVDVLEAARPFELGSPPSCVVGYGKPVPRGPPRPGLSGRTRRCRRGQGVPENPRSPRRRGEQPDLAPWRTCSRAVRLRSPEI